MLNNSNFDVIIIGGSYAGLSAAMALGRSLRRTLIIDSGDPCNKQTPHSHNFLTHDGENPREIAAKARLQVEQYENITFFEGMATQAQKIDKHFEVTVLSGETYTAKKLLFATGVRDQSDIKGFSECWGVSVLHCPYCHGYEVRSMPTGIIMNGDMAYEFTKLISNLTKELILFTNGKSDLSEEHVSRLKNGNIEIIEKKVVEIEHNEGQIHHILLADQSRIPINALYMKVDIDQKCKIPEQLGCEILEDKLIKIDDFMMTTVEGVYAAGDNSTMFRALSGAIASGTKAGAMINKALVDDEF